MTSICLMFIYGCQIKESERTEDVIEIFNLAFDMHNSNNLAEPYAIRAWYSECAKIDGDCVAYTDGLGLMVSHGHECIIPPASLTFLPTNMRKSQRDERWLAFMSNKYREVGRGLVKQTDFRPGYNSLHNAFRWFEIRGPFANDYMNMYNFNLLKLHENYISISFEPVDEDLSRYLKGIIYLDNNNLQLDSVTLSNAFFYSRQHYKFVDGWLNIYYSHYNNMTWPQKISGGYIADDVRHSVCFSVLDNVPVMIDPEPHDFDLMSGFTVNPKINYNSCEWKKLTFPSGRDFKFVDCCNIQDSLSETKLQLLHGKPFYTQYYIDGRAESYDENKKAYVIGRINQILEKIDN